jgi:hypothetical protein
MGHFRTTMKQTIYILTLTLLTLSNCIAQTVSDSLYKNWWANKDNSIFQSVHSGQFSGTTTGYIQLVNNKDTLLLDFQSTKTTLAVSKITEPFYDDNTKVYSTQTTSGKTLLQYETFMLANVLTLVFNGVNYGIGVFDGASDTPIFGLTFNYSHEKNKEYLTLFVAKPLRLTTSAYLFNKGKMSYKDASKNEKSITVLAGSTLILTINK